MSSTEGTCVSRNPVELAVRSFATGGGWRCDSCHTFPGTRLFDSLWLCVVCYFRYREHPEMERWR